MKANSSWHKKGLDSGPLRLWYSQATSGAVQIILTWGSGFRPFMFNDEGLDSSPLHLSTASKYNELLDVAASSWYDRVWIPALYIHLK